MDGPWLSLVIIAIASIIYLCYLYLLSVSLYHTTITSSFIDERTCNQYLEQFQIQNGKSTQTNNNILSKTRIIPLTTGPQRPPQHPLPPRTRSIQHRPTLHPR